MKDNTLRTEIREALADLLTAGRLHGSKGMSPEKWDREISMTEDRLFSAIKNRLPKEKPSEVIDNGLQAERNLLKFEGYNTCLAEVRQALDIESES